MAKIAFVPHPQMGHINPTVRLAKKLQQQGHQVEYLSLSDFASYISSQGPRLSALKNESPDPFRDRGSLRSVSVAMGYPLSGNPSSGKQTPGGIPLRGRHLRQTGSLMHWTTSFLGESLKAGPKPAQLRGPPIAS